jgi:hypothetical protein
MDMKEQACLLMSLHGLSAQRLTWEFDWWDWRDFSHRPHLYQLNSGDRLTEIREVEEGA